MCGRYTYSFPWPALWALLDLPGAPIEVAPRYNVAPTQQAPVIRSTPHGPPSVDFLAWGLRPSWSLPKKAPPIINARLETVAQKPLFRGLLRSKRCIVPASGYYEWKAESTTRKTPYFITSPSILLFAGLWDEGDATVPGRFCIVTTAANEPLKTIHDRTPVMLDPKAARAWLTADTNPESLLAASSTPDNLTLFPVGPAVGSVANDNPSLVVPIIA